MRVVVTGASGRLGRVVVRDLVASGHDVLSLDRVRPAEPLGPGWVADLTDAGDVYQALVGAEGVVHLAAYESPGLVPDTTTFGNNAAAAYNVLKAAADLNVQRVVLASSIAAYGYLYAPRRLVPEYLPLDEEHPCVAVDSYGLSKIVAERIADAFGSDEVRCIVSLRFPGVNFDPTFATFPARWTSPRGPRGLWTYIDARDAARACRLALERRVAGHAIFNAAAPTSTMPEPTEDLIRRTFPDFAGAIRPPDGLTHWSGMSSAKIERALGFRAEHVWSDYLTHEGSPR